MLMTGWRRTMPVVFRDGGLRYFFFSNEGLPRLEPDVAVAESYGFNSAELARILRIVSERRTLMLKAWDDHFGNGRPL
jgi:hypothetical protein